MTRRRPRRPRIGIRGAARGGERERARGARSPLRGSKEHEATRSLWPESTCARAPRSLLTRRSTLLPRARRWISAAGLCGGSHRRAVALESLPHAEPAKPVGGMLTTLETQHAHRRSGGTDIGGSGSHRLSADPVASRPSAPSGWNWQEVTAEPHSTVFTHFQSPSTLFQLQAQSTGIMSTTAQSRARWIARTLAADALHRSVVSSSGREGTV